MLTQKQLDLLSYIQGRLEQGGVSPSFEEMKDALSLKSKSGVHRLIGALEERGFVRRLPNRARALEVMRLPDTVVPAPVGESRDQEQARYNVLRPDFGKGRSAGRPSNDDSREVKWFGRIAAGQPIEAFEEDRSLVVPAMLLGPGEHYAVEVSGDSMIDAGIHDGDYALIELCKQPREGDIVVALIDNHEATLKYFHRERGMVRLDPANAAHSPQYYKANQVVIQGKLAGLLRRYN